MTNAEKLKALLIEMGLLDEAELKSRNELYKMAYLMDNGFYKITTNMLARDIYNFANVYDSEFGKRIIKEISNIDEMIKEANLMV